MKNIHVLPTGEKFAGISAKNIYITSDEEIKEGDWYYYENGDLKGIDKVVNGQRPKTMILKKIILTTDQDLIKDGVQAIDDEFLEFFVKNPSCEYVEVEWVDFSQSYFIKITKEKAKEMEKQQQGYSEEEVEVLIKTTYEETMRAMVDWFVNNKDKNQEEMESAIENYVYPRLAEKGIKFKNK
jgi:hypothetical protein